MKYMLMSRHKNAEKNRNGKMAFRMWQVQVPGKDRSASKSQSWWN